MATAKKRPVAKSPRKKAAAPAAAPKAKGKAWVPLALIALVLLVAGQILWFTRKAVDMQKDFIFVSRIGQRGMGQDKVLGSWAMCTSRNGKFFTLSGEVDAPYIQAFSTSGEYLGRTKDADGKRIEHGSEMAADSKGFLYILEKGTNRVDKFSNDLKFIKKLMFAADAVSGMTVNDKDEIVAIDYAKIGFVKMDTDGKPLGFLKSDDNDLSSGGRIAAAPGGGYGVLSNMNNVLVLGTYDEKAQLRKKWKVTTVTANPYSNLGFDEKARIYVNDSGGNNGVHCYSMDGKYLAYAKTAGPGLDYLNQGCMYVDRFDGKIYVNSPLGIDALVFKWK